MSKTRAPRTFFLVINIYIFKTRIAFPTFHNNNNKKNF